MRGLPKARAWRSRWTDRCKRADLRRWRRCRRHREARGALLELERLDPERQPKLPPRLAEPTEGDPSPRTHGAWRMKPVALVRRGLERVPARQGTQGDPCITLKALEFNGGLLLWKGLEDPVHIERLIDRSGLGPSSILMTRTSKGAEYSTSSV